MKRLTRLHFIMQTKHDPFSLLYKRY